MSEDAPVVGLLANPWSGRDLRRLVASAGTSELSEKVSIVRRVLLGAASVADIDWRVLPEPHGIIRRATETRPDLRVARVDIEPVYKERDTTAATHYLRELGAAAVVTLGGDGTNRAATLGWPDLPVLPLSTGTNNAFPFMVEPTVAGTVVGLVATGMVDLAAATRQAKLIHVEYEKDGESQRDLALIDAVAVRDRFVGSFELFDPETMVALVLTEADPTAIGFSSVGGRLMPVAADDDVGLTVRFQSPATADRTVWAPTAPGHHERIGIEAVDRLEFGEPVVIEGPVILAFDGERKVELGPHDSARLWVDRNGPRVIDVDLVMRAAVSAGYFESD